MFIFSLFSMDLQAQPKNIAFSKYVLNHFHAPESVKANCMWQNILVDCKTDANGNIVTYALLNKEDADLQNSLAFLQGYHFTAQKYKHKNVIFCLDIDNQRISGCKILKQVPKRSGKVVLNEYRAKHRSEKDLTYIDNSIYIIIEDPVK